MNVEILKEILNEYLDDCDPNDKTEIDIEFERCRNKLAHYIYSKLHMIQTIDKNRNSLFDKEIKLNINYKQQLQTLETDRQDLQKKCWHPKSYKKYFGDASGGSDSYTKCMLCNKIL